VAQDNLITIRDLTFYRGDHLVFDQVNLDIKRGDITAIMGPSGCGKTTLLRLIGGQLAPESGRIEFEGTPVHKLSRRRLYELRRSMGMLFQNGALFTHLTCFENVAFPLREHTQLSESMIRDLVLMKLNAVGLRGARDLIPSQLSGGMARRVALARSIALDPQLIMYDEPFTGQDPISMGVLVTLIKQINDHFGMTSIIVSHDVPETARIADMIYVIADGKIAGQGTPAMIEKENNPLVQQFIHGLPDGAVPFHYPAPAYEDDLLEVV